MSTTLEQHTVLPPDEGGEEDMRRLAHALDRPATRGDGQAKLIGPDGTEVELPEQVYTVLRDVTAAMSRGPPISVAPHNTQLTTQEAANLINASRPPETLSGFLSQLFKTVPDFCESARRHIIQ